MNNDFWTSVLVPNCNKTKVPKLILRRVPAAAPGRKSSPPPACDPSSLTRTDVQTSPPEDKDFVWTSKTVPNTDHPNSPKMIFQRFPVPRSKGDSSSSSSSSSPSPLSSPSPKPQSKKPCERGRRVKVCEVKPIRPPGTRRSLHKPTAGAKQPGLVGPRPTWVRNIRAILKERNTQSGKGWRTRPGHIGHKSPTKCASSAFSPSPQPLSLVSANRKGEAPSRPAGRGLPLQRPTPGTQQPHVFMANPDQSRGGSRSGGQQKGRPLTKKPSPPASPPKHAPSLLSSSSSSSRSTSPELLKQSAQLERLLEKEDF